MTAIDGLERLETPALWRASGRDPLREVYISIGEAELQVFGMDEVALSHWSLPAIRRLNPDEVPARYAPGRAAEEELQIDEPEMITALERVLDAVERGKARPGRLRWVLVLGVFVAMIAAGILWLPNMLREQAGRILPPAQREEIGDRLMVELGAVTGPACSTALGDEALQQMKDAVLPDRVLRLRVVQDLPAPALALPGGLLLLSNETLIVQDDPAIAAGHLLATQVSAEAFPPLERFLATMRTDKLIGLLTSGEVPPNAISRHVEGLLLDPPVLADDSVLIPAFAQARLAWTPWADATGRLAPATDDQPLTLPPPIDDTAWQSLRGICDG